MGYTREAQAFLKTNGPKVIDSIEITRTPLSSKITTLLNLITLGKFTEAKEKANYDKLFHLAITITTTSGERFQIEKNETIRMGKIHGMSAETERMHVVPKNIPIHQLIERTRKRMGDHDFFTYSAFQHNCQNFVLNVLRANNILTDKVKHFVEQDPQEILKHLPAYTEKLANILTDLAAVLSGHIPIPEAKRNQDTPQHTLKPNYKVLAVFLDKAHYTKEDADMWIAKNRFLTKYMDELPNYYRYRQIHQDIEKTHYEPKRVKIDNGYMVVAYE